MSYTDGAVDKISAPFYFPDFSIERKLLSPNKKIIAGIDEAGRGALAGPLAVSMVIYSEKTISGYDGYDFSIIDDSKKISPLKRYRAADFIKSNTVYQSTVLVSHKIIDAINVNMATRYGILKLIEGSPVKPDLLIIDGNFKFDLPVDYISVKGGDSKSLSVASASIIAKTSRDKIMILLDRSYPDYGLKDNMGYGTKRHIKAIRSAGGSRIHRRSYEPLKSILNHLMGVEKT